MNPMCQNEHPVSNVDNYSTGQQYAAYAETDNSMPPFGQAQTDYSNQLHAKIQHMFQADDDLASNASLDSHYNPSDLEMGAQIFNNDPEEPLPSYLANLPWGNGQSVSTTSSMVNVADTPSECSLVESPSRSYPVVVISPGKQYFS